tara:strand:+ start:903 stop:1007 length:105 start_codon:yes stop_codon:yes gene_type:complete
MSKALETLREKLLWSKLNFIVAFSCNISDTTIVN